MGICELLMFKTFDTILFSNRLIARQLAKIHAIHAHNGWIPKSNLWLKMGKYFSLIPTGFTDEAINKRYDYFYI